MGLENVALTLNPVKIHIDVQNQKNYYHLYPIKACVIIMKQFPNFMKKKIIFKSRPFFMCYLFESNSHRQLSVAEFCHFNMSLHKWCISKLLCFKDIWGANSMARTKDSK